MKYLTRIKVGTVMRHAIYHLRKKPIIQVKRYAVASLFLSLSLWRGAILLCIYLFHYRASSDNDKASFSPRETFERCIVDEKKFFARFI